MLILSKKESKNKQKDLKKKLLACQMITKQILKPKLTFFLKGSIFIDLNASSQQHISNINYFNRISSSTILRDQGIFYRDIQTNTAEFDSCAQAILFMKQSNDTDAIELAHKLDGYEEAQRINDEIKQQMVQILEKNTQVKMLVDQKRKEFQQKRFERIKQLPKNKYVMFFDFAFDYASSSLKISGNGLNEAFIKLIGCDLDNIQTISMRRGIFSVMEEQSEMKILNRIIEFAKYNLTKTMDFIQKVCFKTLDGISIDTDLKCSFLLCESASAFQGYFHRDYTKYTCDQGIVFCEVEITDAHVRRINAIRKNNIQGDISEFNLSYSSLKLPQLEEQSQQFQDNYQGKDEGKLIFSQGLAITKKMNQFKEKQINRLQQDSVYLDIQDPYSQTIEQNENEFSSMINTISVSSNSVFQNLLTDIPYVVQSQNFLEKFYGIKDNNSQEQPLETIVNDEEDSSKMKKCGFRYITQSKQLQ